MFDDCYSLQADAGDFQQEIEDIAGFGAVEPLVWVVDYAAVLMGGDLVTLHEPLDGRFAVDNVIVGRRRNARYGDASVVDDGGFAAAVGKLHLVSLEGIVLKNSDVKGSVRRNRFAVRMQLDELASGV